MNVERETNMSGACWKILALGGTLNKQRATNTILAALNIPLPPWMLEEISKNLDLVYTDRSAWRNPEYISLGSDSIPFLRGRTPIPPYTDYMRSFRERFGDYLGRVIAVNIYVSQTISLMWGWALLSCGELIYPAYPESNGTWKFPGIGEFQCYGKIVRIPKQVLSVETKQYMRASLEVVAEAIRKTWEKVDHMIQSMETGNSQVTAAKATFHGKVSGKIAGIHWHYRTTSHAAELTAGYYNTRYRDGYLPLAQMFSKHGVVFNFNCIAMGDGEQHENANCSPEGLVQQVKMATKTARVELAGENALERRWEISEFDSRGTNLYIGFIRDKNVKKMKRLIFYRK
ncbi:hypothetical protein GQ457_12G001400 [Hibiscus cannabinus]